MFSQRRGRLASESNADARPKSRGRIGRRLKIFYATQQGTFPPTFILFVNDPTLMHFSYERYLHNQLRKSFDFTGTPIRIFLRERGREDA